MNRKGNILAYQILNYLKDELWSPTEDIVPVIQRTFGRTTSALHRLSRKGLVIRQEKEQRQYWQITQDGREQLAVWIVKGSLK